MLTGSRQHPPRVRAAGLAAVAVVSLLAAACGDTTAPAAGDRSPTGGNRVDVAIDTFAFAPRVVEAHVGDTVVWSNRDDILHTVTSGTRDYEPGNGGQVTATRKDGMFDLQLDGRGATARFTLTEAGSFHYFCDRHPGMEADIRVS